MRNYLVLNSRHCFINVIFSCFFPGAKALDVMSEADSIDGRGSGEFHFVQEELLPGG